MEEDTLDSDLLGTEDTHGVESDGGEEQEQSGGNWEKRYKDVQSWATKLANENKGLKSEMDQLKGAVDTLRTQARTPEEKAQVKDWLKELKGVELLDDPDKIPGVLDTLRSDIKREIAELLEMRDRAMTEQIELAPKQQKQKALVSAFADEIRQLREEDPDMADVPDLALAKMFAKTRPHKLQDIETTAQPRIGGRRVSATSLQTKMEKEADALLDKWGYTKDNGFE